MALIQCSKCGKMHSDTAERCPHCGHMTAIYICPECGAVCSKGKGICIECGYDLKDKNLVPASDDEIMRAYGDALQAIERAMTAEVLGATIVSSMMYVYIHTLNITESTMRMEREL